MQIFVDADACLVVDIIEKIAEMDDHLGYQKSERSDSDDYRNGYKSNP